MTMAPRGCRDWAKPPDRSDRKLEIRNPENDSAGHREPGLSQPVDKQFDHCGVDQAADAEAGDNAADQ